MDELKAMVSALSESQERLVAEIKKVRSEIKMEMAALRQSVEELKRADGQAHGAGLNCDRLPCFFVYCNDSIFLDYCVDWK